ncbi:aldolase [Viridothelium virens]|uniref:Aldolase n=1 Tax=Viridothelium virens TaxID=1048519 RepID=A0A6A6HB14_VIRVR|nr:aldolase [Viridothelium virens]
MSPHHDSPSTPEGFLTSSFDDMSIRTATSFDNVSIDSSDISSSIKRPLAPGVYVPTVAFFDPITEDLDIKTVSQHAVRLVQAGVVGITTQGSNGEAVHLTHSERKRVTIATRKALDEANFNDIPIIVGCGSQSTRETIELCKEAAQSGGDYALVLPPSYYKTLFAADSVLDYFMDVATASPIPIIIYNYPGAVAGLDLSSQDIIELAKHPNIIGCKLTCGNTGKLNRIASATRAATFSDPGSGFMCMGGSADFTLQTLIGGGSGIIAGLGNISPKACVEVMNLFEAGKLKEARKMQAILARGDWAAIQGGIVGTKSAMQSYLGYGGYGRKPLPRPGKAEAGKWAKDFEELMLLEKSL